MRIFLALLSFVCIARSDVTIYTQITFVGYTPTGSASAPLPSVTTPAAFDNTTLIPPPVPNPPSGGKNVVQLLTGGMPNMSNPVPSGFFGFSLELSVADTLLGKNGSFINPELLNLFETISQRSGRTVARVGGNTQEKAIFFPEGLPNQQTIIKGNVDPAHPTFTPALQVGIDLLFAMANISSLTNVDWFIGTPFDTPTTPRLGIAEYSERILGTRLLGLQAGNEPDLFASHQDRASTYGPQDYVNEFTAMVNVMKADSNLQNVAQLVVPSTCCVWGVPDLANLGYFDTFNDVIKMVAIEHYPSDFCLINGHQNDPQTEYNNFMNHQKAIDFVTPFLGALAIAQQHNKPFMVMETNTASCGGLPGFSDSFGAALYLIDAAMQMAAFNFSGALIHVGGQNTFYNPFTPPPGALLKRGAKWTVGAPYYSTLIVAELLGANNASQVVDIRPNNGNLNTPGYAVYENGVLLRAVFINYVTDPTGANDYTAQIAIDGSGVGKPSAVPAEVYVRHFTSNSTANKIPFFYGNQTFGGVLESSGLITGTLVTETVTCDQTVNLCEVTIPAPGAAVVFFTKDAADKSISGGNEFSQTVTTIVAHNTATIDAQVLATSNGYGGKNHVFGSTSFGSTNAARGMMQIMPGVAALVMIVGGAMWVGRALVL